MTALRAVQQSPLQNSLDRRSPAAAPPISNRGVSNKLSRKRLLICSRSEVEIQRPPYTVYYNLSIEKDLGLICPRQEELFPRPASLSTRISVHEQLKYPSVDVGIAMGAGYLCSQMNGNLSTLLKLYY